MTGPQRLSAKTEAGSVTLGGRRVQVEKPRVRAKAGSGELSLTSYQQFVSRDPLAGVVLERMTRRRFHAPLPPVAGAVRHRGRVERQVDVEELRVRTFVARTKATLQELMSRRLDDIRLAVLMITGIDLKGRTNVVALGISCVYDADADDLRRI